MMAKTIGDSDSFSDRGLLIDLRRRDEEQKEAFDNFTVEVTGYKFNGKKEEWDKSGGILGRMDARVTILEEGFKLHTKMINGFKRGQIGMLSGMAALVLLATGFSHSKELVDILKVIFP